MSTGAVMPDQQCTYLLVIEEDKVNKILIQDNIFIIKVNFHEIIKIINDLNGIKLAKLLKLYFIIQVSCMNSFLSNLVQFVKTHYIILLMKFFTL